MEKMKIEIWSDIACPYCYIGKRKLDIALEQFAHKDNIELVWHSYELNPELKKEALAQSYKKFVGISESAAKDLVQLANSVGLLYDLDNIVITNTSDALRICKLAREYNLTSEAEEAFFSAYFSEGKCVSEKIVLLDIAKRIGLPLDKTIEMLDSDRFVDEINADIRYSEDELDLEYIPFYLFNNKVIIQGSVANEIYSDTLEETYNDWLQNGISDKVKEEFTGQACSIDGKCS